ncbi:MAG: hypothetical protein KGI89_14870 [Euryarchaeota archaeon]|nr:hypothetical protein [Euryarchaeota archaeon]MDE2046348.1 hypothetical protein [Thermoplasmata archaeon]
MGITLPEDRLKPLLYALEATVHAQYRLSPRLRDVEVVEALHQVQRSLKDGGRPPRDPLARALREALEAIPEEGYDRNDRAMALRFLVASAKRHRRVDGPRGYLDFVARYTPLRVETEQ